VRPTGRRRSRRPDGSRRRCAAARTRAALCHDVGKSVAALGPVGRALATAAGALPGVRPGGRAGAYLAHAELGARLLAGAGARPETVAWAAAHHDPARWPTGLIPREVCEALALADGESPPVK
jgi:hypothetical protein